MTKANQGLESKGCERRKPEITPGMVDAGMDELKGYEAGGETAQETVSRIFMAMAAVAPGGWFAPRSARRRSAFRG